ncbi:MAG TPA: hypothetical protein PKH98_01045, partial [Candidatus Omnitrophota bacterium]|nr:hypothetical protein [Candidatus Omnitrophota bacterium]
LSGQKVPSKESDKNKFNLQEVYVVSDIDYEFNQKFPSEMASNNVQSAKDAHKSQAPPVNLALATNDVIIIPSIKSPKTAGAVSPKQRTTTLRPSNPADRAIIADSSKKVQETLQGLGYTTPKVQFASFDRAVIAQQEGALKPGSVFRAYSGTVSPVEYAFYKEGYKTDAAVVNKIFATIAQGPARIEMINKERVGVYGFEEPNLKQYEIYVKENTIFTDDILSFIEPLDGTVAQMGMSLAIVDTKVAPQGTSELARAFSQIEERLGGYKTLNEKLDTTVLKFALLDHHKIIFLSVDEGVQEEGMMIALATEVSSKVSSAIYVAVMRDIWQFYQVKDGKLFDSALTVDDINEKAKGLVLAPYRGLPAQIVAKISKDYVVDSSVLNLQTGTVLKPGDGAWLPVEESLASMDAAKKFAVVSSIAQVESIIVVSGTQENAIALSNGGEIEKPIYVFDRALNQLRKVENGEVTTKLLAVEDLTEGVIVVKEGALPLEMFSMIRAKAGIVDASAVNMEGVSVSEEKSKTTAKAVFGENIIDQRQKKEISAPTLKAPAFEPADVPTIPTFESPAMPSAPATLPTPTIPVMPKVKGPQTTGPPSSDFAMVADEKEMYENVDPLLVTKMIKDVDEIVSLIEKANQAAGKENFKVKPDQIRMAKSLVEGKIVVAENAAGKTLAKFIAALANMKNGRQATILTRDNNDSAKWISDTPEEGFGATYKEMLAAVLGNNNAIVDLDGMMKDYDEELKSRRNVASREKLQSIEEKMAQALQSPEILKIVSINARGHMPNRFLANKDILAGLESMKNNGDTILDEADDLLLLETTYIQSRSKSAGRSLTLRGIIRQSEKIFEAIQLGKNEGEIKIAQSIEEFEKFNKDHIKAVWYSQGSGLVGAPDLLITDAVYKEFKQYLPTMVEGVIRGKIEKIGTRLAADTVKGELVPVTRTGELQSDMVFSQVPYKVAQTLIYNEKARERGDKELKLSRITVTGDTTRENPILEMFGGVGRVVGVTANSAGAEQIMMVKTGRVAFDKIGESNVFAQTRKDTQDPRHVSLVEYEQDVTGEVKKSVQVALDSNKGILIFTSDNNELHRLVKELRKEFGEDVVGVIDESTDRETIEKYRLSTGTHEDNPTPRILVSLPRVAKQVNFKGNLDVIIADGQNWPTSDLTHAVNRNNRTKDYQEGRSYVLVDANELNNKFDAIVKSISEIQGFTQAKDVIDFIHRRIENLSLAEKHEFVSDFLLLSHRSSSHKHTVLMLFKNTRLTQPVQDLYDSVSEQDKRIIQEIMFKEKAGLYGNTMQKLYDAPFTGEEWVREASKQSWSSAIRLWEDLLALGRKKGMSESVIDYVENQVAFARARQIEEPQEYATIQATSTNLQRYLDLLKNAGTDNEKLHDAHANILRVAKYLGETGIIPTRVASFYETDLLKASSEVLTSKEITDYEKVTAGLTNEQKQQFDESKNGFVTQEGQLTRRGREFLNLLQNIEQLNNEDKKRMASLMKLDVSTVFEIAFELMKSD